MGSTSITTDSSGSKVAEVRYGPWGTDRFTSGSVPTDFRFTGQRSESALGIYHFGARFYDPALGCFLSADSIIPGAGNPQAYDRYAGLFNNPLRYKDPSGHRPQKDEPNSPIITYDEEHGICINTPNLGCSGGTQYREWYQNWYFPRLPEYSHLHLSEISIFSQDVALGASSAGAGFEMAGFTAGGTAGAATGNAMHQASTNVVENFASWTSTVSTLADDAFFTPDSGTYVDENGVIVIGEASATSLVASVVGSLVPIAVVDAAIDGYVSRYNYGAAPGIFDLLGIRGETLFGVIKFGE
ncbi:MAG: RHS repeat-associated core domain-containing protein [Anaerolineales bacterium]|nr:RHS repeat-associated core domain-containing protein [Anaerolineales bacterium]